MTSIRSRLKVIRERQGSFAVGSAITFVFHALAIAVYSLGSILIARALGPKESGYLFWFISGTTAIAMFADILGIYYSNAYLIAKGENEFDIGTIRGSVLAYGAVAGFLGGLLFGWIPWVRGLAFYGFDQFIWAPLISLNILGLVLISQMRGLFMGHRSFILLGLVVLIKSAGYALPALFFIYVLGWQEGSQIALAQIIGNWACVLGFGFFLSLRGLKRPAPLYLRACMRVGWRAAGINWLSFLHQRIDQYFVNTFLGPVAVGLYSVVVSIGEIITQIPGMLGQVLFPIVAGSKDQSGAALKTMKRTLLVMLSVTVLVIPIAAFAPTVVHILYGDEFSESAQLLRYFLPGVVFLSGLLLINQHLAGLGYPVMQLAAMAAALIINVMCNLILLPRIGVAGAPIASSISYGFWLVFVTSYLNSIRKVTSVELSQAKCL